MFHVEINFFLKNVEFVPFESYQPLRYKVAPICYKLVTNNHLVHYISVAHLHYTFNMIQ